MANNASPGLASLAACAQAAPGSASSRRAPTWAAPPQLVALSLGPPASRACPAWQGVCPTSQAASPWPRDRPACSHGRRRHNAPPTLQPHGRRLQQDAEPVRGEGKPGCTLAPRRGGETPRVSAGPSPLHATRPKHHRSTSTWKPSIDLTRSGLEHRQRAAAPLLSLPGLCPIVFLADALYSLHHPRCIP